MNHPNRNQIVQNLARLRREWDEAAQGQPLDEVAGSVGLLLADVCQAIGLSVPEQALVLGSQPAAERRYGLPARPAPQYEPVAA